MHPNVPVFEKKRDDDDDDDENEDESNPALVPPRCVNVGKEEKKAFGRAKHVQTLSASMFTTSDAQKSIKKTVRNGCVRVRRRQSRVVREWRWKKECKKGSRRARNAQNCEENENERVRARSREICSRSQSEYRGRFGRVFGAESRRRGGVGNHATVFFDHESGWVENAKMRGLLSVPSSSSQFSNSDNSSAYTLVIGACCLRIEKTLSFWAKLVYGEDQFVDILSSTSSPIAKLAREYEQKENEMTTALYRDWIFERCELSAVSALGHPASAGVHFMPVTRIGYDIVKHLARRTREMETMEENA